MGWQDREYARGPSRRPILARRTPGAIPLLGGSIVTTLIVINVVIYVLEHFVPGFGPFISGFEYQRGTVVNYTGGWFEMRSDFVQQGQLWRLVTAQYLHLNFFHILLNMMGLHFLGRPLEEQWSLRRFIGVYTFCGIAGNIFYTFIVAPTTPGVGASGSIYGLLGIAAVKFPHAVILVSFLFPIRIRTAAVLIGLISFASIQFQTKNFGGEACHLAGLLFGVWWAMRGEAWWESTEWRVKLTRKPRVVRPVAPSPAASSSRIPESDQETVDRILAKVGLFGMDGISETEKQQLRDATARLQKKR